MTKNQLSRSILFSLVCFVILWSLSWLIDFGVKKSQYSYYHKINLIANHEIDPQIAIFGSSVGEVALDARVLGQGSNTTSYNFCIDGTRFAQYNGLIKELNEYSSNCELVVLAETFFTLSGIHQLTKPDRFLAHVDNENIYASLHFIEPELSRKIRFVPFYKFIVMEAGYYKAARNGLLHAFNRNVVIDSLQGFTPKDRQWEIGLDDLNRNTQAVDIQIDSATVNEYRKTINELRSNGRKVLVIIPPIQEDGLRLLHNLNVLRRALASMEVEGVYFRDYSYSDLSHDKKYFYNNSHVNKLGAKAFSTRLANTIDSILAKPRDTPLIR